MHLTKQTKSNKPMRKTSRLSSKITESCRWWDCNMAEIVEWTFEGDSETENRSSEFYVFTFSKIAIDE